MLICAPFLEYTEEKRRFTNTEIVCIDTLCTDLVSGIVNSEANGFFEKYVAHEHLVICDAECLRGKEKTQEEIEKLVEMRDDAGKVTTFLVSVTPSEVEESLNDHFFETITRDGILSRF